MTEPAKNLRDAYNAVDPALPLAEDDSRYVDCTDVRGNEDVVGALFNSLTRSERPLHQLCTGHRGSGKSTELRRLKQRLEKENYAVLYFEADSDLDLQNIEYGDLLLAIARQIEEDARKRGISLEKELKTIENWFSEVVYSKDEWSDIQNQLETEASFGLGLPEGVPLIARVLARLTGQIKTGQAVRKEIRDKLERQISQLIAGINDLLARADIELRRKNLKGLVVIVDNLDRVTFREIEKGRTSHDALFIEHGEQLCSLNCHIIYTVPISMFYSPKATQLTGLFPHYQILPMIKTRDRDGKLVQSGIERLKDILSQRIALEALFANKAVDELCQACGGHPRLLMTLATYAIDYADEKQQPSVTPAVAERAIGRLVSEFGRMIPEAHFSLLAKVHRLKAVENDDDHQLMLYNLSVLEYTNGAPPWHDVHPVVLKLPKFKEAWERESKPARPTRRKSSRKS